MLSKGGYVRYGANGICQVEDLRQMQFDSRRSPRPYYILRPVRQQDACLFLPADNPELMGRVRPVPSPQEIDQTILSIRGREMPWIADRKERTARFQEILSRRKGQELLLLAQCLYRRKRESPKGLAYSDEQILRKVEAIIAEALTFSLNLETQNVNDYIRQKLAEDA